MALQSCPCTAYEPAPTKTQLARRWLLRLAAGISIVIVLALSESWLIERAPELSIAVDASADADPRMTPIRLLGRASPPVAVLH